MKLAWGFAIEFNLEPLTVNGSGIRTVQKRAGVTGIWPGSEEQTRVHR